jgi:hypothetical protein
MRCWSSLPPPWRPGPPYVAVEYAGEPWLATYGQLAMLVDEGVRDA